MQAYWNVLFQTNPIHHYRNMSKRNIWICMSEIIICFRTCTLLSLETIPIINLVVSGIVTNFPFTVLVSWTFFGDGWISAILFKVGLLRTTSLPMMLTCSIDVDVLLNTSDCLRYIIRKIREISGQKKETSKYVSFALRREQQSPEVFPRSFESVLSLCGENRRLPIRA